METKIEFQIGEEVQLGLITLVCEENTNPLKIPLDSKRAIIALAKGVILLTILYVKTTELFLLVNVRLMSAPMVKI